MAWLLTIADLLPDVPGGGWVELLLPAGLVLITIGLLASLRARRRRAGQKLGAREQLERYRQEKGVREDLETLMVEIEQLAKRMGTQLDAKAMHLESLIKEAQDRIDELRKLKNVEPPRTDARVRAASSDERARLTVDRSAAEASALTGNHGDAVGDDALASRVGELADQGLTPLDIARRLDEHTGKIELILALRHSGGSQ